MGEYAPMNVAPVKTGDRASYSSPVRNSRQPGMLR